MAGSFISPRTLWLCNFAAIAIAALGLAELIASGRNPAATLATLIGPLATLAWLHRPASKRLRIISGVANGLLVAGYSVYLALFVVAIRFSGSEPQVAGFAFMVFVIAISALNLFTALQRPNNSSKPTPLRGAA